MFITAVFRIVFHKHTIILSYITKHSHLSKLLNSRTGTCTIRGSLDNCWYKDDSSCIGTIQLECEILKSSGKKVSFLINPQIARQRHKGWAQSYSAPFYKIPNPVDVH